MEILHITLFHTSRVETPVPSIPDSDGKADFVDKYIKAEEADLKGIIESTPAPRLILDRILLADSGVLLAVWLDETDAITQIRHQFRSHCPNAPAKQTNIIHTTLFR